MKLECVNSFSSCINMTLRVIDRYRSLPKVAKASLWLTICNFFVAGLGFITGPIFTRMIPPHEYGKLTLFMTYEQLLIILATWEIPIGSYQRGLFKFENEWDAFSVSTLLLVNFFTTILFVFIFIGLRPIIEFTQMSAMTLGLLYLFLLFQPANTCWTIRKRTLYQYKEVVAFSLLSVGVGIAVPIIAILYLGGTAEVKINSSLIVSISLYLFFYLFSYSHLKKSFCWKSIKRYWTYSISYQAPLVFHSLSYFVLAQIDRVMIGKMVGQSEAAFYGVAYTIASAITILQTSLNQVLVPWRYEKLKESNYTQMRKVSYSLLILFGGAIMVLISVAPEIMKLLFTDVYYEAVWCIPPVSTGVYFIFLYTLFVSVETYYEKTQFIMYISVTCGIINLLLNFLLIPSFGYIACAYTTLFSYILFSVFHYIGMKIICNKTIPGVNLFPLKTIIYISFCVLISSLLITLLYPYVLLRYAIVACIAVLPIIFKNKIIHLAAILGLGNRQIVKLS